MSTPIPARRRPWRRVALVAMVLGCGCERGCDTRCDGDTAPKGDPEHVQRTDLIEPGKEPRVRLEIGRWTGFRYTVVVETDSSMGFPGQPPLRAPTAKTTIRVVTTRGTADPIVRERDDRKLVLVEERTTIDSMEVHSDTYPAPMVANLNAQLASMAGTSALQLVAEDGEVVEVKTEKVGGIDPPEDVKRFLDGVWSTTPRFPFRLPPEPVGVGAQWRFRESMRSNQIRIVQIADMIVMSVHPKYVRIRIRSRLEAPPQEFPDPLTPGATAKLHTYRGDGNGEVTIDRVTGLPLDAKFSTTATLSVRSDASINPTPMTIVAATEIRLYTKTDDDAGTLLEDEATTIGDVDGGAEAGEAGSADGAAGDGGLAADAAAAGGEKPRAPGPKPKGAAENGAR